MVRKLMLAVFLMAVFGSAAEAQTPMTRVPDCVLNVTPLTAVGTSAVFDNRGIGCFNWSITYRSYGFTAPAFRVNSYPDSNNSPGTVVSFAGTVQTGYTFPVTAGSSGTITLTGYQPYVSVSLLSKTSGTGYFTATLIGWRVGNSMASNSGSSGAIGSCASTNGVMYYDGMTTQCVLFTQGSIVFAGTSGLITQANSLLSYNASTNQFALAPSGGGSNTGLLINTSSASSGSGKIIDIQLSGTSMWAFSASATNPVLTMTAGTAVATLDTHNVNGVELGTNNLFSTTLFTNATNRFVITGTGVATYTGPFAVTGQLAVSTSTSTNTLNVVATTVLNGSTSSGSTVFMTNLTAASGTPSAVCKVMATGELTMNSGVSTCVVSDERQKTPLRPLRDATALLTKLGPSEYEYLVETDRTRYGFGAQSLQRADPRLADGYDSEGVARAPDMYAILAVTVKALQEALARIDRLEGR